MENQIEPSIFDLRIDHEAGNYLIDIARWAKLFSILGLIAGILIILAGIVTALFNSSLNSLAGFRGLGPFVGIFSMLFGTVYFYPSWLLLKFATKMPAALKIGDQLLVNESLKNLKGCFKFWGIVSLIIVGLYALIFLLGLFNSPV
ncbi:MAG: hypothetical protein V4717_16945 [Bacteroidota bacterium]